MPVYYHKISQCEDRHKCMERMRVLTHKDALRKLWYFTVLLRTCNFFLTYEQCNLINMTCNDTLIYIK